MKDIEKKVAIRDIKKTGYSLETGFTKIGIIVNEMGPTQVSYTTLFNTTNWLTNNFGVDISLFYEENSIPCYPVNFARFHARDSIGFSGHLVATSFRTAQYLLDSTTSGKKIFYINDIEWTRNWFNVEQQRFKKILYDPSIIKVFRSKDHQEYAKTMDVIGTNKIIEDFNIENFLELINGK